MISGSTVCAELTRSSTEVAALSCWPLGAAPDRSERAKKAQPRQQSLQQSAAWMSSQCRQGQQEPAVTPLSQHYQQCQSGMP
jgi:hypothetical protein